MDLSNKNLIIIANVTEETIYFYNSLDHLTTVILVSKSSCDKAYKEFVHLVCDKNCTLIKLDEPENANKLSEKSIFLITTIISDNNFEKIMTLKKTDNMINSQIYELVHNILPKKHYTYEIGTAVPLCGRRESMLKIYSSACKNKYNELAKNATFVNSIVQLF